MENSKIKVAVIYLIIFGLGFGGAWFFRGYIDSKKPVSIYEEEDVEKKIEEANTTDEDDIEKMYSDLEAVFERCNPVREQKAIQRRVKCFRQKNKAAKYWVDINEAEKAVKKMLAEEKTKELADYVSCDANDLTWYEMHCEADRIVPEEEELAFLLKYFDSFGEDLISNAKWTRKTPDRRKFLNPKWLLRSRLVSKNFHLKEPWKDEPHPVEAGTLILLEKKLDGKIYVVGIPVTGIPD